MTREGTPKSQPREARPKVTAKVTAVRESLLRAADGFGANEQAVDVQCEFLHGLGIRERAQALFDAASNEEKKQAILKQYERLTSPEQMGELFKVLAITFHTIPSGTMPGFALRSADVR